MCWKSPYCARAKSEAGPEDSSLSGVRFSDLLIPVPLETPCSPVISLDRSPSQVPVTCPSLDSVASALSSSPTLSLSCCSAKLLLVLR
ncbi:hypothetical protein N9S29_02820 [SAR86 cluster bacterium]|nr:hypothetical protein [SAR86 cluster bacterium]